MRTYSRLYAACESGAMTALADLTRWLEAAEVPAMIAGGIAASILGRPRATRTRVLRLRHTESGIDIDIILSGPPFEAEAGSQAKVHDLSGVQVRLPQLEDLLIMRIVPRANRSAQSSSPCGGHQ